MIDQAEELITLSGEAERDDFLGLLASALDADPRLWIIMIMRTEFLNAFLGTTQARLFRDPFAVGTLGQAALVEVIEQPARRAGLTFDPPTLPQQMAADAGRGDALPLLAYALQELCLAAGRGGVLTANGYQRIGGVAGVLTRQADKVAAELGDTDPTGSVLSTLLQFVTIGENEPTRRRVQRRALTEAQWRVAEAFIAARLMTSDGDDAVLEVAHEALFHSWAPLRQAIEASADQLRWRTDLERWARDWENSGRQDAYLLRDERLKAAQRWAASNGEVVDGLALVAEFLACSNQADRSTMERLSETLARQALGTVDRDPEYSLLLAITAYEECASTALALRAMAVALVASQVRVVLRGHSDWVYHVAWSPNGQRLATASVDQTGRIWDAETGSELVVLRGHDDEVWGVAWSSDGQRLATASVDQTGRIWDAETGSELVVLRGHDDEVRGVAWSPDGRLLATASGDWTARIWDAETSADLAALRGHNAWVLGVVWAPRGQRLATASFDRTARIWDAETGSALVVLRGHDSSVRGVAWSPDGQRLATGSRDRTARIWDVETGNELVTLHGHDDQIRGVAWSPDGQRLLTGSADRTARIWDAETGSELVVLRGHDSWVQGVAWSPDGRRLATGSDDRTARIWDAETGNEVVTLRGHDDQIWGVAWSPDGRRLLTGSADRTARIWDAESGVEIIVVGAHTKGVESVSWSPDGRRVASASQDGTCRIWDAAISIEDLVANAHRRASRELTAEERRNLMLPPTA
jgi:WD40 repeat protein